MSWKENTLTRIDLLEAYIDELIEKTIYHVNISEHTGDMRNIINMIRKDAEVEKNVEEKKP